MRLLRVATFNIQHGLGRDRRVDLDRLGAACARLRADVLGLQEVDVGATRSHGADLAAVVAAATGLHASFGLAMTMPDGGLYGNALLTRDPHTDVEVVALPTEPEREQRVALVARVDGVSFGVTHLSVGDDLHRRQLAFLRDLLPGAPRVLLGDFNHEDPELPGWQRTHAPPTFPARRPRLHIDHIATDGLEIEAVEVVELDVSDHRALVATMVEP